MSKKTKNRRMNLPPTNSNSEKAGDKVVRPEGLPRMPDLTVPYELGEAILRYLGNQPYAQVHQLIAGLARCAQAAQVPKE